MRSKLNFDQPSFRFCYPGVSFFCCIYASVNSMRLTCPLCDVVKFLYRESINLCYRSNINPLN